LTGRGCINGIELFKGLLNASVLNAFIVYKKNVINLWNTSSKFGNGGSVFKVWGNR
jgi:hypothetical protein